MRIDGNTDGTPLSYQVAMTHPAAVTACNLDLENLITDSNRSIATLAITTLLKTGGGASVDKSLPSYLKSRTSLR